MPKRTPRPPATVADARKKLNALGWSCEELRQPGLGPRKARGPDKSHGPLTPANAGYWLVLAHRGEQNLAGKAKEQLAAWLSLVEQADKLG